MKTILYVTVLFLFSTAAFFDLRMGRIPNRLIGFGLFSYLFCLTAGALCTCFSVGKASSGAVPCLTTEAVIRASFLSADIPSVSGLLLSASFCVLLLFLWRFRLIGGGDVKLYWLLFLFLPGFSGVFCFLLSFLFAFPAALYGLAAGIRKVRLGGAMLLSVIVYTGLEAGVL